MAHPDAEDAVIGSEATNGGRSDATFSFYEREGERYARATMSNDLSALYPKLLQHLPPGGLILDAGSGSGRDIGFFKSRGFRVEAFDASPVLARFASGWTGVDVAVERLEDWVAPTGRYDGIWSFASLLHVAREDLPGVLDRMAGALRPDGWLFASFKRGSGESSDAEGRRYTNLMVEEASELFDAAQGLCVAEAWQAPGPTSLEGVTNWVYVLARSSEQSRAA